MKKAKEQRNQKILQKLMQEQHNKRCMDCLEKGPFYVCTNFGTFVCNVCSGIHRESQRRVKSTSMSTFTDEEIEMLQKIGNSKARQIWLGRWNPNDVSEPKAGDVSKIREFMKQKYEDKKWYDPNSDPYANEKDKMEYSKIQTRGSIPTPEPITNLIPNSELEQIMVGGDIRIGQTMKKNRISQTNFPQSNNNTQSQQNQFQTNFPQQNQQFTNKVSPRGNNTSSNNTSSNVNTSFFNSTPQQTQPKQNQTPIQPNSNPTSLINTNKLPSLLDFDIPTQLPPPQNNNTNTFNPFQQQQQTNQQTNPLLSINFQQTQPQQQQNLFNPLFQQQTTQQTNPLLQQQPLSNPLFQQQTTQQTNPLFQQQPLSNPLFQQQQTQPQNPLFQQQFNQQSNQQLLFQQQQTNPLLQQQQL